MTPSQKVGQDTPPRIRSTDIAVIGMSCFYPRSNGLGSYWNNILTKIDAVTEVPASHWDWRLYYDPDPRAKDKIVSKWGGFLDDILFDPLTFGMPPNTLPFIEPHQLMLLEAVRLAIKHAGYSERPFDREQTCAILGIGGGGASMTVNYGLRSCMPLFDTVPGMLENSSSMMKKMDPYLPEWTEDSFPGILHNVAAGRVANRFNFGGANYAIDAACASSLAALQLGIRELEFGTSNVAVVMGGDTVQTPYAYMAFSKTHALSQVGKCRPFDDHADGIVLSEGIGVVILKRLEDAEKDGDKIWAVIKGMGASSDGKDKGLTAPRAEGQLRALRRAYKAAGVSPCQISLVEAHGTGTVVGDRTEATALRELFIESGAGEAACALGSVKSLIGHSKCAAGIAGLIKTVLALHHKVLPPTHVEKPNVKAGLDAGPLYLNTETRPWVQGNGQPRRAGVSAFGFGGTNFHAVLEEYRSPQAKEDHSPLPIWPAELLIWRNRDRQGLIEDLTQAQAALVHGARPILADWALSLVKALPAESHLPTLVLVASSIDDAKEKIAHGLKALNTPDKNWHDPRGIWFSENPGQQVGKVAVLFPGQGSQYVNMLAQTALAFPRVRGVLDRADAALHGRLGQALSRYVYPPSVFTPEQEQQQRKELMRTDVAQPAVGTTSLALWHLLHDQLGLQADFFAGHSYGEFVALHAAGALSEENLLHLSHQRGAIIHEATGRMPGAMAAVEANADQVLQLLEQSQTSIPLLKQVTLANLNSPTQTVISGSEEGIEAALKLFKEKAIRSQRLPVACGFHSPLMAQAEEALSRAIASHEFKPLQKPVFSNVTASAYPAEPKEIVAQLQSHLTAPVRFQQQIESLYEAGARIFVEVGPQGVLTGLVSQILKGRQHLAVASESKSRPGLVQLHHLLAQLIVHGIPLNLKAIHSHRSLKPFDLSQLKSQTGQDPVRPTTWMVNSVRSKPINGPEPKLIGQSRPTETTARKSPMTKPAPSPTPEAPPQPAATSAAPQAASRPTSEVARTAAATPAGKPNPEPGIGAAAPETAVESLNMAIPMDESGHVMLRFQDLMGKFLDTQKAIMLSYLQGGQVHPAVVPAASPKKGAAVPSQPRPAQPTPSVAKQPAPVHNNPKPAPASAAPKPAATPSAPVAKPVVASPAVAVPAVSQPIAPRPESTPSRPKYDRESLLAQLLDLVSQRTGYPKEMLDLDLDLEADLGIDSIKRVEILGTIAESIEGLDMSSGGNLEMEKLTTIRTLRGIVEFLDQTISRTNGTPVAESPAVTVTVNTKEIVSAPEKKAEIRQADVMRLNVTLTNAPLAENPMLLDFTGPVLITDDGRGVAKALAERLTDNGQPYLLIRMSQGNNNGSVKEGFSADLTNPEAVAHLIERIRTEVGSPAGLIHLLPLARPLAGEREEDRCRREVKSLYLLCRGLEADFRQHGKEGQAILLGVTALGGRLGIGAEPLPAEFFAGQGGILGFTKCLGFEWPEVLVRAVDLDASQSPANLAEALLAEMGDLDGPLEVGISSNRRVTTLTMPAPTRESSPGTNIQLNSDSVILITGGARGITAEVAIALAKRYQSRLVLVGRSPLPGEEAEETRGRVSQAEIKAALMAQMQKSGQPVSPALVEASYQRLLTDREIRNNLDRIRKAGSEVEYHSIDVRKEDSIAGLIQGLEARHGRIDGVIHGAGVIEDRLLRDKTPESFERVFGTKVDSSLILLRHLKPDQIKFLVLFSSIAGRYGNRGQSDYAAANEVLAKLADDYNRRWPGRVVSMAWGPWGGVGMVADLEKHLVARGLQLITAEVGSRLVVEEIERGTKNDPEIVVAGGSEKMNRPARSISTVTS